MKNHRTQKWIHFYVLVFSWNLISRWRDLRSLLAELWPELWPPEVPHCSGSGWDSLHSSCGGKKKWEWPLSFDRPSGTALHETVSDWWHLKLNGTNQGNRRESRGGWKYYVCIITELVPVTYCLFQDQCPIHYRHRPSGFELAAPCPLPDPCLLWAVLTGELRCPPRTDPSYHTTLICYQTAPADPKCCCQGCNMNTKISA